MDWMNENSKATTGERIKPVSALYRIANNAIALFALQGLAYLISFLTIPYLLRTLGTSSFGSIAFANSVMAQFVLLTDFGFASSATRLVAIYADDRKRLGSLFSEVMGVKFILLGVSASVCCVLVLCFAKFRPDRVILAVAFLQVFGAVLFPSWLFQGMERMRLITGISLATRLLATGLIFLLVRGPGDTVLCVACQSAGALVQGAIAIYFAVAILKIKPQIPTVDAMWQQFKDSFHPFLGASLGNLVGGSSVLFLGMFKSMAVVGTYAAVERTARAEVTALLPISQAAYPHLSQRFHEGLQQGNRAMIKLCTYLLGGSLLLVSGVALFSRPILQLLYGAKLLSQAHLFSSFSIWAFLSLLNTLLGLHYLIASGHAKSYGRSVFWSATTTVLLFAGLIPRFGSWGALTAVVVGELVQTGLMLRTIYLINTRAGDSPDQKVGLT